jgi:hypothetical protein
MHDPCFTERKNGRKPVAVDSGQVDSSGAAAGKCVTAHPPPLGDQALSIYADVTANQRRYPFLSAVAGSALVARRAGM